MARPIPRHTFERRARLRRAIHLRRRRQARKLGFLAASLTVLVVSFTSAYALVRHYGGETRLDPLYALDQPIAEVNQATPVRPGDTPTIQPVDTQSTSVDAIEPLVTAPPTVKPASPVADEDVTTFNNRPVRAVRTMRMLVTAYCPGACCCGKHDDGRTAAGYSVWTNRGKLVAADTRLLPFGSIISVPGYDSDRVVPVLDVGAKIKGHRLDLLMPTHREAQKWGKKWLTVTVYEYAD